MLSCHLAYLVPYFQQLVYDFTAHRGFTLLDSLNGTQRNKIANEIHDDVSL